MEARHAQRIEWTVDLIVPAALAAAAAYAALRVGLSPLLASAGAGAAYLAIWKGLRSIGPETPSFPMVEFDPAPLPEIAQLDELLLTRADRLVTDEASTLEDALVLDDVLTSLGSDSRVVRLFDPAAMPDPARFPARIDRNLDPSEPPLLSPDASQALHDALAELRRTLR